MSLFYIKVSNIFSKTFSFIKKTIVLFLFFITNSSFAINTDSLILQSFQLDTAKTYSIEESFIKANKKFLPRHRLAKQINTIATSLIERSPVLSVEQLLAHVSGVDVLQRGPHGVQADISIRGGSFDQVAILLNGVNLSNPQTGHYSFDIPINIADIERIEIQKGPSSLLYGASAFAGAVNIITKKDSLSNTYANLEGGMYALLGVQLRTAHRGKYSKHSASLGYKRSDGYIKNSDYQIANFLWQSDVEYKGTKMNFQLGLNGKNYGANTFYSPSFPNQYDETRAIFASISAETGGILKLVPQLYWSRHYDSFHLFRPGTQNIPTWYKAPNHHRTDVYGLNLNFQYTSFLGITSFGGEIRNEGILSNNIGRPMRKTMGKYHLWENRTNISLFAQHNITYKRIAFMLGGIYIYNTSLVDSFGAKGIYPALNLSYSATDFLKFNASWSQAMRMPTFTDLYYKAGKHRGFAGLKPEYTNSVDFNVRYAHRSFTANLEAFYSRGDNLIDWILDPSDDFYHAQNIATLDTYGAGLDFHLHLDSWLGNRQPLQSLHLSYNYMLQDSRDAAQGNPISMYIFNYLRHKFTFALHHRMIKNLHFSWYLRFQDRAGHYQKYIPEQQEGIITSFTPFVLLDLKIQYLYKNFTFFVNANNLSNTTHVDYGNIPQPGIWVTGGLTYHLNHR